MGDAETVPSSPPATSTRPSPSTAATAYSSGPGIGATVTHWGSTSTPRPPASTKSWMVAPTTRSRAATGAPPSANAAGAVTQSRTAPAAPGSPPITSMASPRSASVAPVISHVAAGAPVCTAPGSKRSHSSAPHGPEAGAAPTAQATVLQNETPPARA